MTSWFLEKIVAHILLDEINFETFLELIELMKVADVKFSQKILEFSIESKIKPQFFEMLLTLAEETISLEQILRFASQLDIKDERIIKLIEKRIPVG